MVIVGAVLLRLVEYALSLVTVRIASPFAMSSGSCVLAAACSLMDAKQNIQISMRAGRSERLSESGFG